MMKFGKIVLLLCLMTIACNNSNNEIIKLVKEWNNKKVLFPKQMTFTILGKDTVDTFPFESEYKIVSYSDSIGCISCKLKLRQWMFFIEELDSLTEHPVPVLFFLYPKNEKDMRHILIENNFDYPVCIDHSDNFGRLNMFPSEMRLQTFLLDKDDKVVAIGNPIHNPKIKELYLKIILGNKMPKRANVLQTDVQLSEALVDMDKFDWHKEQEAVFTIANTGISPLAIIDVTTSCGCTSVEYDKEPVKPGSKIELIVKYKADEPGHFSKSIKVFCNADESPLSLRIIGEALSD